MEPATRIAIAGMAAQALWAAFLACLLFWFHRSYRRHYLFDWSLSWICFALFLTGGVVVLLTGGGVNNPHPYRLAISTIALTAGYWQGVWLVSGSVAMVRGERVSRRVLGWTLALTTLALAGFVFMTASETSAFLARVELRQLGAGVSFLLAGLIIVSNQQPLSRLGRRVMGAAFLAYGCSQIYRLWFTLQLEGNLQGDTLLSILLLEPFDLVWQVGMGLGMVIWLLNEERTRALSASEKLRLTQQELVQSQKMEAMGRLAGGVAHDFNNLLTVIRGHNELLASELGPDQGLAVHSREIEKAAERAARLTRQLLVFSRRQVVPSRVVDLNEVVQNSTSILQHLIGEDIQLEVLLERPLGRVKADAGQLEQVILNLAINARDAMAGDGRLLVETSNWHLRTQWNARNASLPPGQYVRVQVSDSGHGMGSETLEHIFEPFFTTKKNGRGTGLGLSVAYGIVRQCGGAIWADSELLAGTTFSICFPRVQEEESLAEAAVVEKSVCGSGTVLVVEDEAPLRRLAVSSLQKQGYRVLEAENPNEALRISRDEKIDLLLTDVVMPGMSGEKLADRMLEQRPDLTILFMSGYPDDAVPLRDLRGNGRVFLQKPFTLEKLAFEVAQALNGSAEQGSAFSIAASDGLMETVPGNKRQAM